MNIINTDIDTDMNMATGAGHAHALCNIFVSNYCRVITYMRFVIKIMSYCVLASFVILRNYADNMKLTALTENVDFCVRKKKNTYVNILHPTNRNICPVGISFIWAFHGSFPTACKNCPEFIQ
jgi:hypothetical protein